MVAPYVASFYFSTVSGRGGGWSENVALDATIANAAAAMFNANVLAVQRVAWLSTDCILFDWVVRQIGPPRDSLYTTNNAIVGTGPSATDDADLFIRTTLQDAGGNVRQYDGHGVPATWVTSGALNAAFAAAKAAAYTPWATTIGASPWAIKLLKVPAGAMPILSISTPGLGLPAIITMAAPHGIASKVNVQIRGYRGYPVRLANGFWSVFPLSATTLSLLGSGPLDIQAGAGGSLYVTNPTSQAIASTVLSSYIGSRKVGRVFGQQRGRKSPVLLHH